MDTSLPNPIPLDIPLFRAQFTPAFDDTTAYPDSAVQMNWNIAGCFVSTENYGNLHDGCRQMALNLLVAHLFQLNKIIQRAAKSNGQPGIATAATIDKVSITLMPPPVRDSWDFWLNQTPYGQQLLALLMAAGVGGFHVGGLPERSAFRKVYGRF